MMNRVLLSGAGAALLIAVVAPASCILPSYEETGATSSSSGSSSATGGGGMGGASTTSSTSGGGSTSSNTGGGGGGDGGGGSTGAGGSLPSGQVIWQHQSSDASIPYGVAVSPQGEVLVAGGTMALNFGPGCTAAGNGILSPYVVRFDGAAPGTCKAPQLFLNDNPAEAFSVAADSAGSAILGGYYTGNIKINGPVVMTTADTSPFVAKAGASSWVFGRISGGGGQASRETLAVAVQPMTDKIVATGRFKHDLTFEGSATPPSTASMQDQVFVAELASNGAGVWADSFGSMMSFGAVGRGIAVASSGEVFVTGTFFGALVVGPQNLMAQGVPDAFVVKLDPSGKVSWAGTLTAGQGKLAWGKGIAVAGANALVTGYATGPIAVNGCSGASAGVDGYLARFNVNGNGASDKCARFKAQDASGNVEPQAIAVDAKGNVFVVGDLKGSADFGGGAKSSAGGWDVFIVKLDAQLNHVWSKTYGDDQDQHAVGVAVGPDGGVVMTGTLLGSIDFGAGVLQNAAMTPNVFVVKLTP